MTLTELKKLENEVWVFKIEMRKNLTEKEKEAITTIQALLINEIDKLKNKK